MEIIDRNLNINYSKLDYGNIPVRIILHQIEAKKASVEEVNDWHLARWGTGIGYNFYVRKDGTVYLGRPINAIGAHTQGYNESSIGVAFEGSFMIDVMTESQFNSGITLIKYLKNKYGITELGGHCDYNDTNCPGTNFPLVLFKVSIGNETKSLYSQETEYLQRLCNQLEIKDQDGDRLIEDGILGKRSIYAIKNLPVLKINNANAAATTHIQNILKITPDGIYGNETEEAVKMWQSSHGLEADGIVGPNTWLSFS